MKLQNRLQTTEIIESNKIEHRATLKVAYGIEQLEPYKPTSSINIISQKTDMKHYKLDWNEATILPSPKVMKAISEYLQGINNLNWYPEILSNSLRKKLEKYTNVPAENIIVTNGSDDALELINKVFVNHGDQIIVPIPTYTHFYVYAGQRNAEILKIESPDVFKTNLNGILSAITDKTKLIYIVNPNNPTGVMYNETQIREILEFAPHAILIVDEAYYEFAGISMAHLVKEYSNLVVTRTFSKSFGLAAQRVGYLMASSFIVENCLKVFNPKSVNRIGQIAAEAALDDVEHLDAFVRSVTESKRMLKRYFLSKGLDFKITPANYVMVHHPMMPELVKLLEVEGVYVRDRSGQLSNYMRMSVGTVEQTEEVISIFDKVLDQLKKQERENLN